MKNKNLIYIIITSFITIILLYITDQVLQVSYLAKVLIKILLFSVFPIVYIRMTGDNVVKDSLGHAKKRFRITTSHILGLAIFIVLLVAFHLVKGYMNIDVLISEFKVKYKIDETNILYYGVYLAFINSLLEEFFFRGFMFLNLKKLGMKKIAYYTSSIAFSLYHVSNFQNWFNIWVFILATAGLFLGGIIFSYLDDRENTFLNSWFVHICADLAIVGIGLSLFQVI